ncbi:response regulator [Undibacterium sp. 5I1]|uniref:ANTAR domain-containing response regulator n=1 Tax=unclassified Undibacterium TaxID=2630295 RepID=UPI002AB569C1|nr:MULTISPECIES: response regulator [unclassified Undibacterium]MDY7539522.1 response regulator [Undibacterium sp. 5I1]MEB0232301.1 response regulator [Undibacterium sp. 10I3]MEB0258571.1 response regulator [Undibacterium sp. 5I1]
MLKAVILDNQAVARNLLSSVLTTGGHEIVGDGNTSPAVLARIVKLKPQIVCVDIGETNQEGLTLLDTLRSELPKALIFLVSAKIDAPTLQAAQERGVQGFIVKPFNSVAVLASIRNTIIRIAKQQASKPTDAAVDIASDTASNAASDAVTSSVTSPVRNADSQDSAKKG